MKHEDLTEVIGLLAEANPKTIFLELAFLESWSRAADRRFEGAIPGDMIAGSLPFLAREMNFRLRPTPPKPAKQGWLARLGLATT